MAHVFFIEALLQLQTDAFRQNCCKEILYVIERFLPDIVINRFSQCGESVRQHVIDVFYEYALILCH